MHIYRLGAGYEYSLGDSPNWTLPAPDSHRRPPLSKKKHRPPVGGLKKSKENFV